jgi:predicted nucleic acid-binding protein
MPVNLNPAIILIVKNFIKGADGMGRVFIDTNVIVYANDKRDREKQKSAVSLLSGLMDNGLGVVSTQVLQEYAVTALTKLHQKPDAVLRILSFLEYFEVVKQTPAMIRRAVELKSLYSVNFWDACIISSAESAGCSTLLTEDLNPGQFYSGIEVRNPFAQG